MDEIYKGIGHFKREAFPRLRDRFAELAAGQSPKLLLITCSDSRIDPSLLLQSQPGEVFVIRNAGNLVPPADAGTGGEAATIQYAVEVLGIRDIAICGHTHCGAMAALGDAPTAEKLPAVGAWLEFAKAALENRANVEGGADSLTERVATNVLVQLDHLRAHPSVAGALSRGEVDLHAWVYDFEHGRLLVGDENGRFAELDTRAAQVTT